MTMIRTTLENKLREICTRIGLEVDAPEVDIPTDLSHGDLMTNVALAAKYAEEPPRVLAERIAGELTDEKLAEVRVVEVAGPGFINITLSRAFFINMLSSMQTGERETGDLGGEDRARLLLEYTDPNPFKVFHIGHFMSNAIGEALARLSEDGGSDVTRLCYQGDVGMHVAKAVWGMQQDAGNMPADDDSLDAKAEFLGNAYQFGARKFEDDEEIKRAIQRLNKEIYERSNEEVTNLYNAGRRWSIEYFETIYERLGTRFDGFFFESDMAEKGQKIVWEHLGDVFVSGENGAVIYRGEEKGLHTRVFLNSEGLPTYEAKDLALAHAKDEVYAGLYDTSIVVTAEEQREYFKVVLSALKDISPELAKKSVHMTHGMMKLATGKMSSRSGNIVSAEELIALVSHEVEQKMAGRVEEGDSKRIAETIALGALKFWILKQSAGQDVVFDVDRAVSLEGDSGPYIQYAAVRAQSVFVRAREEGIEPSFAHAPDEMNELERELFRFEISRERSIQERAPHHVAHALLNVASAFNRFYGEETIADPSDPLASYRVALTQASRATLEKGLELLGIRVPEKM